MRSLAIFLLFFCLAGCAASQTTTGQPTFAPAFTEQTLWRMRLGEEATGFTGLLAISRRDEVLDMVVLDPSGFKLFEGSVDREGKLSSKFALPLVEERGLPEYLAVACHRIFFREPGQLPCAGVWFDRLCLTEEPGVTRKIASRALVPVWEVAYYRGKDNSLVARISLRNFWLGPSLTLDLL